MVLLHLDKDFEASVLRILTRIFDLECPALDIVVKKTNRGANEVSFTTKKCDTPKESWLIALSCIAVQCQRICRSDLKATLLVGITTLEVEEAAPYAVRATWCYRVHPCAMGVRPN